MYNNSLKKNAFLNMVKTFSNIIFPLITFPYVTRILEADNLGKIDFSKSIVNYFILISSFGIIQYAVREGSSIRNQKEKLYVFTNEIFSLNIVTTLVAFLLLLLSVFLINALHPYTILILIFSANVISNAFLLEWLFTIEEDFMYTTIRSILLQFVSLILMFIFVRERSDYYKYAIITAFSLGGSSFFNYFYSRKYVKLKFTFKMNFSRHFKPMMVFFLSNVASAIYLNSDITVIGLLSGTYYVGIYSVAVKVYTIIKQVSNSLLLVSVPRLSYFTNNNERDKYNNLLEKIFNSLILFLLPAMMGIIMLSNNIVYIIAGENFERSSVSLSILAVTLIFSVMSALVVYGILIPNKLEKKFLMVSIASAVLNILANFILVPFFQEVGAAISTLFSELMILISSFYFGKNYFKISNIFSNIISAVIGSIIVLIVCLSVNILLNNTLLICLVSITISVILYLLFLVFTKNNIVLSLINYKFK